MLIRPKISRSYRPSCSSRSGRTASIIRQSRQTTSIWPISGPYTSAHTPNTAKSSTPTTGDGAPWVLLRRVGGPNRSLPGCSVPDPKVACTGAMHEPPVERATHVFLGAVQLHCSGRHLPSDTPGEVWGQWADRWAYREPHEASGMLCS